MCQRCRNDFGSGTHCEVCDLPRGNYTHCPTCFTDASKEWQHELTCYWYNRFPSDYLLMRRFGQLVIQRIRQQLRDTDTEYVQKCVNDAHVMQSDRVSINKAVHAFKATPPPVERRKRK